MDKNSLIGFLLILLIVIGFTWLNKPTTEQQQAALEASRQRDSIAHAQAVREAADTLASQLKRTR
jgi:YidC/Oxa1 family membrane protein insertase